MTERDCARIPRIVEKLQRLWQLGPDRCLGQTLRNVVPRERLVRNNGNEQTLASFEGEQWEAWVDEALRRVGNR